MKGGWASGGHLHLPVIGNVCESVQNAVDLRNWELLGLVVGTVHAPRRD